MRTNAVIVISLCAGLCGCARQAPPPAARPVPIAAVAPPPMPVPVVLTPPAPSPPVSGVPPGFYRDSDGDLERSPSREVLANRDYRAEMRYVVKDMESKGDTVIWPHNGSDASIGIVVPDGIYGESSFGDKEEIARTLAGEFSGIRTDAGQTPACEAFVRFEPSGTVVSATVSPHKE